MCVRWLRQGADGGGKKGWQSLPPVPGVGPKPLASINSDACVRAGERVCAWRSESPASAGMEMSLVMHLPPSLVPDSLSRPCIAHVCRLLPVLHPSLSVFIPTASVLHPQPSLHPLPAETKTKKPPQVPTVWLWGGMMLCCCLCCLGGFQFLTAP